MFFVILVTLAVVALTLAVVALIARLEFALRHFDRQVAELMRDVNPSIEEDWYL